MQSPLPRPRSSTRLKIQTDTSNNSIRGNLETSSSDCPLAIPVKPSPIRSFPMAGKSPLPRDRLSASSSPSSPLRSFGVPLALTALLLVVFWLGFWPWGSGSDPSIVFLSVGDYGSGKKDQKAVAAQMAITAQKHNAQFIVSLGDNIYEQGPTDVKDPLFYKCFEDVYTQPSLQKRWLITLGDHDHRGSVAAEVAFTHKSSKWYLPAPYYSTAFQGGKPGTPDAFSLEIITTDSIGLEACVATDDPADRRFYHDYNMTVAGKKSGKKQLKWLKRTLADSTADWKVVVGHRPVLTAGVRPRYPVESRFPAFMKAILQKYHVAVYLFGHDHIGQHLEEGGVTYLGSGVGGYGTHDASPSNSTVWADGGYLGFMLHKVTAQAIVTDFIDKDGVVLHTATISRNHEAGDLATAAGDGPKSS